MLALPPWDHRRRLDHRVYAQAHCHTIVRLVIRNPWDASRPATVDPPESNDVRLERGDREWRCLHYDYPWDRAPWRLT